MSAWTTDKTTPPGRRPADNRPLPKLLPRSPTYLRAQLRIMKTPGGWYRTSSRQQNDSSRRPARLYGGGPARGRRQQTRRRGPGRAGGEARRRATASQPARDSETNPLAPKDRLGRSWSIARTLRIARMSLRATICWDSLRRRFLRLRSPAFTNPINRGAFPANG